MPSRFILVVDPSPVSWQRVGRAMAGSSWFAMSARSLEEALAAAAAGEIGLVVGSMNLPDATGYDLARRLRAVRPGVPVLLLGDGGERYDAEQGAAAGVAGVIDWPSPVDRLRQRLESAVPAIPDLPSVEDADDVTPIEPLPEVAVSAADEVPEAPAGSLDAPTPALDSRPSARRAPLPAVGDERVASFLPRDWKTYPPVRVDPAVVQPAIERAILEVLPEVVEVVLRQALATSPGFRDLVEAAVDEAVRAQLAPIARSVVRERLAELEAASDEQG